MADLQHAVLLRLRERIRTTKALINDMLRWPELYTLEASRWKAAHEALERAELELRPCGDNQSIIKANHF